jgi:hypothetical protein
MARTSAETLNQRIWVPKDDGRRSAPVSLDRRIAVIVGAESDTGGGATITPLGSVVVLDRSGHFLGLVCECCREGCLSTDRSGTGRI